jgi:phosphopantetheinyl transferase
MRDVSGGRSQPPTGFWQRQPADPLAIWQPLVAGVVLVERQTLAPFAAACLSADESRRLKTMTDKRKEGYLSARLALKRLSRLIAGEPLHRDAQAIETMAADKRSPQCPTDHGACAYCSVSHDHRFTVAVAADRPVGVDVEPLSPALLKGMHLYMQADEEAMLNRSNVERIQGALRIWSAKEAAAKAMGIDLATAWHQTRVVDLGTTISRLTDRMSGEIWTARHAVLEDHVFTLLTVEGAA